jgi:outer membrane protein assembly factor BamD (BamD/ComL family)
MNRTTPIPRATALLILIAGGLGGVARAEGTDKPTPRREKITYNGESGKWIETQPPQPGTADGDLRLARAAFTDGHLRKASKRIDKWMEAYTTADPLYPQAALLQAEVGLARQDYYKTYERLEILRNEYEGTEYARQAVEMEFVIAEVFLTGKRRKLWGMRVLNAEETAIGILDDIAANYPETEIAERALKTKADYYFDKGEFMLAELEYATLIQEFPRGRHLRWAMRRSADAALASFPGIKFDDAPLIEAQERYLDYLRMFPEVAENEGIGLILDGIGEQRAEKEYDIGHYYERAGHPDAAVFYYRSTIDNWPDTIGASQARQRLLILDPSAVSDEAEPWIESEPVAPPVQTEAAEPETSEPPVKLEDPS